MNEEYRCEHNPNGFCDLCVIEKDSTIQELEENLNVVMNQRTKLESRVRELEATLEEWREQSAKYLEIANDAKAENDAEKGILNDILNELYEELDISISERVGENAVEPVDIIRDIENQLKQAEAEIERLKFNNNDFRNYCGKWLHTKSLLSESKRLVSVLSAELKKERGAVMQLEQAEKRIEELEKELKCWKVGFQWVTPGGSEFQTIHECQEYVCGVKDEKREAKFKLSQEKDKSKGLISALEPFMKRLSGWREMLADGSVKEPISKEWLAVESAIENYNKTEGE